ncbi:hypothetical protein L2719_06735 [Shewanella schlegeliana]|uniref:Uncharacterized protein n=1 Tax=Shewanella schlegeliana TaxID=190308 RepID=A0ABS1SXN0_9GAMM|nr:hypothetical protein [Shewanella schlegeliana]MBL4913282.1 hypothetical protein [Shewanella schlegeliana]MCL1109237.1 hypothetical protein [Shewanella schlegeliana]GIU24506.1 hypothetical protein TUM4433_08240 [Shewanella schlegeliana]
MTKLENTLKNKLKDELKDELKAQDYQVEEQDCKLKVKLGGLATPVYIENDFANNRFIVNTQDVKNGMFYGAMLFIAQISTSDSTQALVSAIAVIGLFTMLLTELKSQMLKQQVASFNRINTA